MVQAAAMMAVLMWLEPAAAQTSESARPVDSVFAQMQSLVTAGNRAAAAERVYQLVSAALTGG